MNRRTFVFLAGSMLHSTRLLRADHRLISTDPVEAESDLTSLRGRYTPVEDFYIRNHFRAPDPIDPPALAVEGQVQKPCRLTVSDLNGLPTHEIGAVLECAGNPVTNYGLVSNGRWSGWRLGDILSLAEPAKTAAYVHLFGRDGYRRSVELGRVTDDGLLVTRLGGRALPRNHGAPWRALFPGWYGMDSVKWLERVVVSTDPLPPAGNAYLEARRDLSGTVSLKPLPRLEVKSVFTKPADGSVVQRGKVETRGLAWTGEGRISEVRVSSDDGGRWTASVETTSEDYEWTPWASLIDLTKTGAVHLTCRATDSHGRTQPAEREASRADGYANNWCHRIRCVVV